LVVVCSLSVIPHITAGQEDAVGEYELKAAILYNLTNFVEWPASSYPDSGAPTIVCVLGRDPFGGALTSSTPKEGGKGRPVVVRRVPPGRDIQDCHVLYISSSERKTVGQIFSTLKGTNVLTVGEMSQFALNGGMIQFTLVDRQVQFEINLDVASQGGLKISSRLLALARIVHPQSSGLEGKQLSHPTQSLELVNSPLLFSQFWTPTWADNDPD
jgi:YfiR/HmsC-like